MDADVVAKIKKEYVEGNDSLRELARRHGLPTHTTVGRIAKREDWTRQRETYRTNVATKTAEKTASQMARIVGKALEAIENQFEGRLDPQGIRQLTGALKDVRDLQAGDSSALPEGAGVIIMPAKLKKQSPPEEEDE